VLSANTPPAANHPRRGIQRYSTQDSIAANEPQSPSNSSISSVVVSFPNLIQVHTVCNPTFFATSPYSDLAFPCVTLPRSPGREVESTTVQDRSSGPSLPGRISNHPEVDDLCLSAAYHSAQILGIFLNSWLARLHSHVSHSDFNGDHGRPEGAGAW
jgi:hypothetical protein